MAKNRIINTKFWTDTFVMNELTPIDKLFYIYLLTNPYTDISGVYELPLKVAAVEMGIDRENIENVLIPRFETYGKILYRSGWVAIKNFIKHQTINPKVTLGIKNGLEKAPQELKNFIQGIDYHSLSDLNSNSNSNTNTPDGGDSLSKTIQEFIHAFKEVNPNADDLHKRPAQRKAAEWCVATLGKERAFLIVQKTLPATNALEYFPTITTPSQLKERYASLEAAMKKRMGKMKAESAKSGDVYFSKP